MAAFDQIYAVDPNNSQNVAESGVISIYAPGTRNLIALKTVTGGPLSNPLQLNSRGFGPAFIADGYTLVAWEAVAPGEVFQGTFKSYEGVLEQAVAAKTQAAEGAAAELAQRIDAGEFNGSDGQDGKDGSNVLPTATAIAQAITTPGSPANTALSATFDRVFTPEEHSSFVEGAQDNSTAIQAAINMAVGTFGQGGMVRFKRKTYNTASKLTLHPTVPIKLSMPSGGSIVATAAMTAVLEKPAGACSGIILDQLTLDGASLADAALDFLQGNRLVVFGGQYMNGKVTAVDFGRTGLQVYESEWLGGKVIGRNNTAGKTAADRPPFAFRVGAGCTDNKFSKFDAKNAMIIVQDAGQGNSYERVHTYGYPYRTATNTDDWNAGTVQFNITGYSHQFVQCVVDSPEIGFRVAGGLNTIIAPVVLWPGDSRATTTSVGIDILVPGITVMAGLFNNPGGANVPAIGVRVATAAYRATIIGNQFQGVFSGGPIVNLGPIDGDQRSNFSDTVPMIDTTKNRIGNIVDIDRGNGNDVIIQWGTGKGNPARLIAVGTGATGYIRLDNRTAGGGWQIGATGNSLGFFGKTPVVQPTGTPAAATDLASALALINDLRAKLLSLGVVA